MNYWAGSAPWSLGWSLSLAFRSTPAFLLQLFLRPLGTAFYFWQKVAAWGEARSQSISLSLSCVREGHFWPRLHLRGCSHPVWTFLPPWPHLLLGRLCCGPGSGQMAWLLDFGDTIIPLGPTALEGSWLPVLINFGSCFLIPVWLFSLFIPTVAYPLYKILWI